MGQRGRPEKVGGGSMGGVKRLKGDRMRHEVVEGGVGRGGGGLIRDKRKVNEKQRRYRGRGGN